MKEIQTGVDEFVSPLVTQIGPFIGILIYGIEFSGKSVYNIIMGRCYPCRK